MPNFLSSDRTEIEFWSLDENDKNVLIASAPLDSDPETVYIMCWDLLSERQKRLEVAWMLDKLLIDPS